MNHKLVKSKLPNIPEDEQEKIFNIIGDNADLLKKVGEEIEILAKENGGDHMKATLEVMEKYKSKLKGLNTDLF